MVKQHSNENKLTPAEAQDRVWELAKHIDICTFTTWDGKEQRSRPLSARVKRDEHAIYFLVDVAGHKNAEIQQFPHVSLAFADNGKHNYVTIVGEATLSNDRAKIAELWTDFDRAWWEDENEPDIRLITVEPTGAELWDGPNQFLAAAMMLASAVTGAAPSFGDNAKVML